MVEAEISCANLRNKRGKYGQWGKSLNNSRLPGHTYKTGYVHVGHETLQSVVLNTLTKETTRYFPLRL